MKFCYILPLFLLLLPKPATSQVTTPCGDGLRVAEARITPSADRAVVSMTLCFDEVRVRSNAARAYIPVLRGEGGEECPLPAVLLSGRRQHIVYQREGSMAYPDVAAELRRIDGTEQRYVYTQSVPLEGWMKRATLALVADSCGCGINLGRTGVDTLARLRPDPAEALRALQYAFVRPVVRPEGKHYTYSGRAYLDFPVNRTEIHPDYRNNAAELHKIIQTIDIVRRDTNATITGITIHGYASPEGTYANNDRLARERSVALRTYVSRLMQFPASLFVVRSTPEDWAGLDSLVAASNIEHREAILALVRSDMDPDAKNDALRDRYPEQYRFILTTWYPALRHSDYTVAYSVRTFTTVDEARRVYAVHPEQLSLDELYMVASAYPTGSPAFDEVFLTTVRLYPDDAIANLNAANVALRERDLAAARTYLERAGTSPEAENARAALALIEGRYADAAICLERAGDGAAARANRAVLDELR